MRSLAVTLVVLALPIAPGLGATPQAFPGSGAGGHVFALETFNGGLIAAGEFTSIGGAAAHGVARWDGATWSALGAWPLDGVGGRRAARVFDAAVYNGKLYVGGAFVTAGGALANNVACWDELTQTWTPLGSGTDGWVLALEVYDNGSGPALYVGGDFETAGGVPARGLARWNDTTQTWSPAGSFDGPVNVLLAAHFEGQDRLFVGGDFETAGALAARNLVALTGNAFTPLAAAFNDGVDGVVLSLAIYDDGLGDALYVGGDFGTAGATAAARVAYWRGGVWSPLGTGVGAGASEDVRTMVTYDDGGGPVLVVGGQVTRVGTVAVDAAPGFGGGRGLTAVPPVNNHGDDALGAGSSVVGSWDGTSWSGVGQNMNDSVFDMQVFAGQLYAAGRFTSADNGHMQRIARWNALQGEWVALSQGLGTGHAVRAFAELDVGDGAQVFVGGDFVTAGSTAVGRVARWDDALQVWAPLGQGTNGRVLAMTTTPTGLVVGGAFTKAGGAPAGNVALWDALGSAWSPLGAGVNGTVRAVLAHDDGTGGALYAAGDFDEAGGVRAHHIARWDGAAWADLPAGGLDDTVRALVRYQGDLIAGGDFRSARGGSLSGIARWDGTAWTNVGAGFDGDVHALHVTPSGLYAGGTFSASGALPLRHVARWNGFAWEPLGPGLDGPVVALDSDNVGGVVFAGGRFAQAGGVPASNLAAWDGATWAQTGGGADDWVRALLRSGTTLYAGGNFNLVGGTPSTHIVGIPLP